MQMCECVSGKSDINVIDSCCRNDQAVLCGSGKREGKNVCVCLLNAKHLA